MSGCTGCGGCASGCGGCQSHVLLLTEAEIRLLRRFGELAFLPVACTRTSETPVYLTKLDSRAAVSAAMSPEAPPPITMTFMVGSFRRNSAQEYCYAVHYTGLEQKRQERSGLPT